MVTEAGPTARKRILVVANPTAGSGRAARLEQVIDRLEQLGCSVTLYTTRGRGDAERFVDDLDCTRFDAIAAGGGDGTINEVLNGMPFGGPPLAVLPLGTANVLACEIGLARSADVVAGTIAFGPSRPISIGVANGRRFAMMASVGLDAEVVERVDLTLKRYVGKGAYLYETIKQIITSTPSIYRLRFDHDLEEASGIIIANGRHYAGRYIAAPRADLERPSLEVCRLTRHGRLAAPSYLLSLVFGRLAGRSDVKVTAMTSLSIPEPAGAPLQADGDVLCRLPATISVLPAAIDLIFPRTTGRSAQRDPDAPGAGADGGLADRSRARAPVAKPR